MRVIDPNPESCGWSMEAFCTGYGWDQEGRVPCGAKLEVADKDLRSRSYKDISGVSDTYYVFECPICHCCTEVPTKKIPYEVRSLADKKHFVKWTPDND